MSDKPADVDLVMPSGNRGRVTFRTHGDSLAAGIMWKVPPSSEDVQRADAVILDLIQPYVDPTVQIMRAGYRGCATQQQHEQVLDRFLKAGDN